MTPSIWFLALCLGLSFYCLAIDWLAQVVTYPLFRLVNAADFGAYHVAYQQRIRTVLVGPVIATRLAMVALVLVRPPAVLLSLALLNAVVAVLLVLVTVGIEVPNHRRLRRQGKSEAVIGDLITRQWLRTLGSTVQTILTLWMVAEVLPA
jgi:hypothetical protein